MKKLLAAGATALVLPASLLAMPHAEAYDGASSTSARFSTPSSSDQNDPVDISLTIGASNSPRVVAAPGARAARVSQRGVLKLVVKIGPEGKWKQRKAYSKVVTIGKKYTFTTPRLRYKGTYRVVALFRPYSSTVYNKSTTRFKIRVR